MLESDTDEDSDDDSDDDWSEDEDEDVDVKFMEVETKTLTPEEKKKKAREDYDREMKEIRRKEYHRVWDDMLRCTWPKLLSYRSQLGLSNESYQSHRYHCNRDTNQLY